MSQKSTSLNPSASEFVPNFAMPNMSNLSLNDNTQEEQTYQPQGRQHYHHQNNNNYYNQQDYYSNQNQQPQQFYGQNYNTSHRHSYNPNYRGNNYRHNYRHNHNNNYYGNNSGYNDYYGNNNYHNNHQQQQNYDVDSFELEARCEAVIEILQDDKIRDQLNPNSEEGNETVSNQQQSNKNSNTNNPEPELDDEEEMAEMMAMQEECRLEMMKFYIQSQNPALFESIYHDVSYPEAAAAKQKVPEEELRSPKVMTTKNEDTSTEDVQVEVNNNTLKDLIINELNPDVPEFVPNKFSNETETESPKKN